MAASIRTGRVLLGGVVAGLVMMVLTFLDNSLLLMPRMTRLMDDHKLLPTPRLPFLPLWLLILLLLGIALVWLYAAVRPRLGPGPRTALLVGLVVGLLAGVPENFVSACWQPMGRLLPFMWMVERIVGCVLGTLVGAWLYREEGGA